MALLIFCIYLVVGLALMIYDEWREPSKEGFYVKDIPMLVIMLLFWPFFLMVFFYICFKASKMAAGLRKFWNKKIYP